MSLIDLVKGVVLEKGIPDHRSILLKDFKADFGPTPFHFFHSWLELDGLNDLVVQTWKHDGIVKASGFISFKKKLQNLKRVIRDWVNSKRADSNILKNKHQSRLASIDVKVDQGCANNGDFINSRESMKILNGILSLESKDLAQKAKIKRLAINGILKNEEWIEEPDRIKSEFFEHFCNMFQQSNGNLSSLNDDMSNMLSPMQRDSLETQFSHEDIKRAVWDYGGDRDPGPYGFTFKFIKTFWDLIKDDVFRFVNEFFHTGLIPKGCNSSFIVVIPKVSNAKFVNDFCSISLIGCQYKIIGKLLENRLSSVIKSCMNLEQSTFIKGKNILDGPLIINEVMAWFCKRKKELMGIETRGSFIPLSFHLAMEGLHMLTYKAEEIGIFKGATFGNDNMCISHLIYADDVIFIGEWSTLNANNLLCMLPCIYLISGLKINVNKSHILGVGISESFISILARSIVCEAASFPMKYLRIPIGCNMATFLIKSVLGYLLTYYMSMYPMHVTIVKKLESMRNKFFLGGDMIEKKMSWVRWNQCLASKDLRGLGIDLLSNCVRKIGNGFSTRFWEDVWCGEQPLKTIFPRIYLLETYRLCLVKNRVSFLDMNSFLRRQPRGDLEMNQFIDLHAKLENIVLTDQDDSWSWTLNPSGFPVASVRHLIDSKTLDTPPNATRWIRHIPIKVNIFVWRLMLNTLPVRVNLDRRGIDVDSVLCPKCQADVETINYIFFSYYMALELWAKLARWWDLYIPICANYFEWIKWLDSLQLLNKVKAVLEGVGGTLMWSIWSFRNCLHFFNSPPRKAVLWDSIVS
nr:RNA-directed DNA polymerase, eukaryota, reverse transcriptase zinc-binding domain protein [Tanacetum cinerariifolium]